MFQVYDTDGSGMLDSGELRKLVQTLEVIYSYMSGNKDKDVKNQVDEIMKKIDCNNDGSISVYEWIEQGKAINLLDPLTSAKSGTKKVFKLRVLRDPRRIQNYDFSQQCIPLYRNPRNLQEWPLFPRLLHQTTRWTDCWGPVRLPVCSMLSTLLQELSSLPRLSINPRPQKSTTS